MFLSCDASQCQTFVMWKDIQAIPACVAFKDGEVRYKCEGASTHEWEQVAIDVAVEEGWLS
jgi:hypothetical protein